MKTIQKMSIFIFLAAFTISLALQFLSIPIVSASGTTGSRTGSRTGTGTRNQQKTNIVKVVQTGSSLYVTKVVGDGSLALAAGFSIGTRISAKAALDLHAVLTAETKNEYKTDCVPLIGANAICVTQDWHMCASTGCPKAGTFLS